MTNNTIFLAIGKETGNVMSGAKGQYAFGDVGTLRKSMYQSCKYLAEQKGVHHSELYDIHELDVKKVLQLSNKIS